jgi:hypothetical protein
MSSSATSTGSQLVAWGGRFHPNQFKANFLPSSNNGLSSLSSAAEQWASKTFFMNLFQAKRVLNERLNVD